jgi:Glycosyl transferase family 2.
MGAAAARNLGFSLSRGDYIQWLDADDLLAPDKIATQMDNAMAHDATKRMLFSSTWGRFMYRFHRAHFVPTPLWCDLSPLKWLLLKLDQNLFMPTATWLVSRELTEAAGPWNTQLLGDDDGEYFCRILRASNGIRFIPTATVFYRMSGTNSLSYVGRSHRKMEALFLSMQLHIGYLRSLEDSARVRVACVKYLQNQLLAFHPERPDIVRLAHELAATLGGRLELPRLSWKYAWIQEAFGWPLVKQILLLVPRSKWCLVRSWDKGLSLVDRKNLVTQCGP